MALFPHLEHDEKVQLNDKIRLSGSKSFVSKGSANIATMTVKPYEDIASAVDIWQQTVDDRFLDWSYSAWEMDVDSTNNRIDFKEGSTEYEATLSSGTYTLTELATEIKTQLDASGSLTYTVSFDDYDKLTISATGGFSLVPSSLNILKQLGFQTSTLSSLSNSTTYTGKRVRYLTRRITLTVGDYATTDTSYGYIKLFSVEGDYLFSNDSDLTQHEPDILKWLPDGKNSYRYAHRRAQELILKYLDEKGYTDHYGDKLLIEAVVDIDEVREWSIFVTLRLIMQGLRNAVDDVFSEKTKEYMDNEKEARSRAILRLDLDGDGVIEANSSEGVYASTINSARR